MSDRPSQFHVRPEDIELFSRFFNGPLQDSDLSRLEQLLRSNPAARELFVKVAEIDGMLKERLLDVQHGQPIGDEMPGSLDAVDPSTPSMHDAIVIAAIHEEDVGEQFEPAVVPPPAVPLMPQRGIYTLNPVKFTAAAIVLLCVCLTGYFLHRPGKQVIVQVRPPAVSPQAETPPAVLGAVIDGHFKPVGPDTSTPVVGATLPDTPLFLESGWARLDFPNDVSAVVEGPAVFTVKSAGLMRLDRGRLSARVSKQGRGFTVESGTCRVVDLGTDFGMFVSTTGVSEVQVFEGQVALSCNAPEGSNAAGPAALIVTGGQAFRVDRAGVPAVRIPTLPAAFVRVNEFLRWASIPASDEGVRLAAYHDRLARMPGLSLLYVPDASNKSVLKNRAMTSLGSFDIPISGNSAPGFGAGRIPGIAALTFDRSRKQGLVIPEYPITHTGLLSALVWVRQNDYIPYASIIKSWGETKSGAMHFGLMGSANHLEIQLDGTLAGGPNLHSDTEVPIKQWVAVAFVSDGSTVRLYQDGVEIASAPSRPIPADQVVRSLSIGFKTGDDGITPSDSPAAGFWDGQIGEIAIFDRALSAGEILQMSQSGCH